MVEYIYDAIKAVAGQDAEIEAVITDDTGEYVREGCRFMLHNPDGSVICMVDGECDEFLWRFNIPAHYTEGLRGRYSYCIGTEKGNLCFLKPFYLV